MNRAERILVVALCALVGAFYLWTVRSSGDSWQQRPDKRDYYNRLIDGWLDGQLHMKTEVSAELLALKNPYDPAERKPGLGLHDASFFRGKYYLYFGIAPAFLLMLPWRIVSGADLPLPLAVLLFVYGGFLLSVAVFGAVRRKYFPESGRLVLGIGVLTLGMAGAGLVLLRRPAMWELPIGGGYFFAMLTLLMVWRSLHAADIRGRLWWFAASGLALGLAIASRPTYLVAGPLFAAPLVWWWRSERRWPGRELLAALCPLAIVGAAMAWHNQARFGSPLEFGQSYQFSLDYESKLPHFGARYVPFTAKAHFLSAPEWQRYFPFIRTADLGEAPRGFTIHRGDVYGVLTNYPIAWLALLAPLALWRREKAERGPLGAWLAAVALLFGGAAALMLSFFSALSRYQVDFMPAFMVLATVGLLAVEHGLPSRARLIAGLIAAGAAAYAVGFGILFSLQFDGMLRERNPALASEVARVLNRVPAFFERVAGVQHGPIELSVRWATAPAKGDETLLSIGRPPLVDRVVARHLGDGRVQWGFVPADAAERFSAPRPLAMAALVRVRVSLASLFPPPAHPFFEGRTPAEVRAALRSASINVEGETALAEYLRLERATAGEVHPGRVESWRRVEQTPAEFAEALARLRGDYGAKEITAADDTVRLRVWFRAQAPGTREPLLVTGRTGAGEIVMVEHLAEGVVRFTLDSWGRPLRASPPHRLDFSVEHVLGITHGVLATVDDATAVRGGRAGPVRISLDDRVVWEERSDYHVAEHAEVFLGRNPIGGTSSGPVFSGEILTAERAPRE